MMKATKRSPKSSPRALWASIPRIEGRSALVHEAVKAKDWFWNNDYNILNGVHTHGQRYNPFGPQNYPDEVKKTREMAALRDTLIHESPAAKKKDLAVDDSKTHKLPAVPTNYQPSVKNGSTEYLYGDAAEKA
jgi:hypothetical protein